MIALEVWKLLERDGSIDWAGFDIVVDLMGIQDIDGLVVRLQAIKSFKRKDS